ncbi:hypothetical protein CEUSTIGMA_g2282.t1 [Chlamydomonas eustigma]|uniref:WW domain-containing protein n=1 Tax=Chlamydomonas eustigma TaxID=1157962 RepID=A0A250WVP7_9CHLO|nr:hypothetical protein CEUSTIGMA_g2282.t1 [Chlamydomonas eustigma]|eukprot:GAX74836.1 hypothetical protein CEUSTIGMA_g2282.t1 [Chlamydomonas eustigma]
MSAGGATVSTGENDALKFEDREGLPPNSSTIVNSPIAITRTPDLPSRLPDACVGVPIQKEHFEHVPSLPIENEHSFGLALQLTSIAVDLKHSLAKDGPCQENDHDAVEAVELTTKAAEVQSNHDLALSMITSSQDFTATSGREEEAETSDDVVVDSVVDSGMDVTAETTKEVVAVKSTTESTTEEVKAEQSSLEVAYVEVLPEDDATVTREDADANRTSLVTDDLAEASEDVAEAMEDLVIVPSASGDEGTLFMRPPLEEAHTVMSPEDEAEAASSSEVRGTVTSVSATQPLSDLQTDGSESLKDDSPSDTNQQLPAGPQKETSTSSLDKILCANNQLSHDEIVSKNASSLDNLLVPVNLPPSLKLHEIYISFQERLQEALLTTMAQVYDLEKGIISEDSMVLPQIPEQQGLLCDSPAGIQWQAAVVEYAKYLGMDPQKDKDLMFIAHRAIEAEVPAGWTVHLDEQGFEFFAHLESRISQYEHPMDTFYRNLYNDTKERRRG